MNNNLKILIRKSGMTQLEFGMKAFPDMPTETDKEKNHISKKVSNYCDLNLKSIKLDLMHRFCVILDCSYNELWDYEPQTNKE